MSSLSSLDPEAGAVAETEGPLRPACSSIRPTRVEIDVGALRANAAALRRLAATQLYAVVKADAYGHGAPAVARALDGVVDGFCVSLVEEGVALRGAGVTRPILVMGPAQAGGYREMLEQHLTPVVSDRRDLEALHALGRRRGTPVEVHLKIDTGMNRLGIAPAAAPDRIRAASGVAVVGLMTHFACADIDDPADASCMTYSQLARFAAAEGALRSAGVRPALRHAANSSAAMLFPSARLDLVRVGLALYGNGHWATDAELPLPRRQAMRLVTEVVQLRTVAAGESVGYGALWRTDRDRRVAVLPLGYADGLPRRASGQAQALIRGRRCPLVGAISMDLAIADVSALPEVTLGDDAVLLGAARGVEPASGEPDAAISTAEYASWSGLLEYEVTCGMSKRVPRVYMDGTPLSGIAGVAGDGHG